jgi:hypothetical protein
VGQAGEKINAVGDGSSSSANFSRIGGSTSARTRASPIAHRGDPSSVLKKEASGFNINIRSAGKPRRSAYSLATAEPVGEDPFIINRHSEGSWAERRSIPPNRRKRKNTREMII